MITVLLCISPYKTSVSPLGSPVWHEQPPQSWTLNFPARWHPVKRCQRQTCLTCTCWVLTLKKHDSDIVFNHLIIDNRV